MGGLRCVPKTCQKCAKNVPEMWLGVWLGVGADMTKPLARCDQGNVHGGASGDPIIYPFNTAGARQNVVFYQVVYSVSHCQNCSQVD